MPVRGSLNYVWFTENVLGNGTMGIMYFGRHKRRGEAVAIKVFTDYAGVRYIQMKKCELDVLKTLDHQNLRRYIDIENESHSGASVLVMELCSEGSLLDLLLKPEHVYGLVEDDILTFIKDIYACLNYLRVKNIKVQDLRPTNIMCAKSEDGQLVFKLSEIVKINSERDEDNIASVDYPASDVYGSSLLLRDGADKAVVWSIGCALYHVLTGAMPYQPHNNIFTKENLTKFVNKPRGQLSGIEKNDEGVVEWSSELPRICFASEGIRKYLLPLVRKCLNREHQMQFHDCINTLKGISEMQLLHVFVPDRFDSRRVYLKQPARLYDLKVEIAGQMNLPVPDLLFVFENAMLPEDDDIVTFNTSLDQPIILLSKFPTTTTEMMQRAVTLPAVPTNNQMEAKEELMPIDTKWSRRMCALMKCVQQHHNSLMNAVTFSVNCAKFLSEHIAVTVSTIEMRFSDAIMPLLGSTQKICHLVQSEGSCLHYSSRSSDSGNGSSASDAAETCKARLEQLCTNERRIQSAIREIKKSDCQCLLTAVSECLKNNCKSRISYYSEQSYQIYKTFLEREKAALTYNDFQVHKYDKMKLTELIRNATKLLSDHCVEHTRECLSSYQSWYNEKYLVQRRKLDAIQGDMDTFFRETKKIHSDLLQTASHLKDRKATVTHSTKNPQLTDDALSLSRENSAEKQQKLRQLKIVYLALEINGIMINSLKAELREMEEYLT